MGRTGLITGRVINGVACVLWHTSEYIFIFRAKDMSYIGIL